MDKKVELLTLIALLLGALVVIGLIQLGVSTGYLRQPFWTYWYYHLPNFVLAALMYTLLGRALLALIVQPHDSNYIWRAFCRLTDPVVALVALVTPKAAAPVVIWLFGVVWLFWLRVLMLYGFLLAGLTPKIT